MTVISVVVKDLGLKDKDKDKESNFKDKDKDLMSKDEDKDEDLSFKDKDKDLAGINIHTFLVGTEKEVMSLYCRCHVTDKQRSALDSEILPLLAVQPRWLAMRMHAQNPRLGNPDYVTDKREEKLEVDKIK